MWPQLSTIPRATPPIARLIATTRKIVLRISIAWGLKKRLLTPSVVANAPARPMIAPEAPRALLLLRKTLIALPQTAEQP